MIADLERRGVILFEEIIRAQVNIGLIIIGIKNQRHVQVLFGLVKIALLHLISGRLIVLYGLGNIGGACPIGFSAGR